jgi:hypothetical protein
MPMNVGTETTKVISVHGNVTEDTTIHHMICTNISKVRKVVLKFKDIMVAFDQDLIAVQPSKSLKGFAIDYNITEVINFVVGLYSFVPTLDHFFVHFLRGIPRTELSHAVGAHELADAEVTKMGITY